MTEHIKNVHSHIKTETNVTNANKTNALISVEAKNSKDIEVKNSKDIEAKNSKDILIP